MRKYLLAAAAAATAVAIAPALAQTAPAQPPKAHHGEAKEITRAEMVQRVQQHFARVDANNDGFVTREELAAARQAMRSKAGQRMSRGMAGMFERLDTNKNGVITRAEAEAAFAARAGASSNRRAPSWDRLAARFDTNKDGVISRAEFDAAIANRGGQRGQRVARAGERQAGERHGAKRRGGMRHGGMGHIFGMANLGSDGRISLQEATAAATRFFDKADTNRDGVLTRDEMRAARQAMRATRAN
jgi:Ca2+-binding EF-hand superfamily protein